MTIELSKEAKYNNLLNFMSIVLWCDWRKAIYYDH